MYETGKEKIDGFPVYTEKGTILVPALNLRQVKALAPDIKKMDKLATEGDVNKLFPVQIHIIKQGLRRNYPEITDEEIEDFVDMNNVEDVTAAVTGAKKGETIPAPGRLALAAGA